MTCTIITDSYDDLGLFHVKLTSSQISYIERLSQHCLNNFYEEIIVSGPDNLVWCECHKFYDTIPPHWLPGHFPRLNVHSERMHIRTVEVFWSAKLYDSSTRITSQPVRISQLNQELLNVSEASISLGETV